MSIFISSIFLGLSISAPMGPINALQWEKGIRQGFIHSWLIGIGAMTADALFMLLIFLGIMQVAEIPLIKLFLWLFGFFVLCYTGIESIVNANTFDNEQRSVIEEKKRKSFRIGFLIALSNPLNILFWLGIYGSLLVQAPTKANHFLFTATIGIFVGIIVWDVVMAWLATVLGKKANPFFLRITTIASGIVLIGFGAYFGVQAYLFIVS
ncbi:MULTISPECIES: LysE family transporter [unclassified Virgibacillus]|uniref:LysE family transporter n=1 Tax=unclassified Virgibacillus TaxID=2620237 RepID=UPI0024DEE573|nr:LysE family transporter [Virgibacillus sp. LDC-1]